MWVYEEMIEGRKLTEIINEDHENVKYLPGVKLPENVRAVPELLDAARDADLFVFVIPHQFISRIVGQMKGNIKDGAAAISLIKVRNLRNHLLRNLKQLSGSKKRTVLAYQNILLNSIFSTLFWTLLQNCKSAIVGT